jgi:hypothetical protein
MQGGAIGGGFVVGADAGVGPVRSIDADIDKGDRIVGEQSPQPVVMAVAAKHETVDAAADQVARLLQLHVKIVAAGRKQQHITDRGQVFL